MKTLQEAFHIQSLNGNDGMISITSIINKLEGTVALQVIGEACGSSFFLVFSEWYDIIISIKHGIMVGV